MKSCSSARDFQGFCVLCLVLWVLNSTCVRAFASDNDWSQASGNAGHTRYVNVNVAPASIKKLWDVPILFDHTTSHVWSEWDVAIDDKHVYRTALEGYPPSGDFHVLALELGSGAQGWSKIIKGRAHAGVISPSVGDGIVYVNRAGHSGISGGPTDDFPKLYGLNAETGQEMFATNYSSQWGSYDRPSVRGNTVMMEGGYYGGSYAYDATSGAVRWSNDLESSYLLAPQGFYSNAGLRSYTNGAKIGDLTHPSSKIVTPLLASSEADLLLATSTAAATITISAFSEDGATWNWDRQYDVQFRSFAATKNRVIVAEQNKLEILDRATGNLITDWDSASQLVSNQLAVTNTHAFVQNSNGLISAINLITGQSDWSQSAPISRLAVGHDILVLSSRYAVTAYALVPEPTSWLLLAMCGLALPTRRRHSPDASGAA